MIYEAVCKKCRSYHEYVKSVAECLDTPICCGEKTQKVIFSSPSVQFDVQPWESFVSPATGKMITSKAQRKEDMRESGCRDWEGLDSEKNEAARQKKYEEQKQDEALDKAVRTAWAQLPPSKKAQLLSIS